MGLLKAYGNVIFNKGGIVGASQHRALTEKLNELGIIYTEPRWIEETYLEDLKSNVGTDYYVALYGIKHIFMFRNLLIEKAKEWDIDWGITFKKPWFLKGRRSGNSGSTKKEE